ncbi:MAG: hypothetical protein ACR2GR_03170 [Rhodothermales bacterium]
MNTVRRHGSEDQIRRYVERQGRAAEYERLHWNPNQVVLFGESEE